MADQHLFDLSPEWDLAFDPNQWMIRRRKAHIGGSEAGHSAVYRWEPKWYVGGEKRTLHQYIEGVRPPSPERPRIHLTPEAQHRLDMLPASFLEFRAMSIESTAAA